DIEKYLNQMKTIIVEDPEEMSNAILTALRSWMQMDKLLCEKYPILKQHSPGIDMVNFNQLLLPYRKQMIKLHSIERYIDERQSRSIFGQSIYCNLSSIDKNSFPVRFYKQSPNMTRIFNEIIRQAMNERENKRIELQQKRD